MVGVPRGLEGDPVTHDRERTVSLELGIEPVPAGHRRLGFTIGDPDQVRATLLDDHPTGLPAVGGVVGERGRMGVVPAPITERRPAVHRIVPGTTTGPW